MYAAVYDYVKESMQKIEKIENGRSITYSVVEGDLKKMYDPYIVTFSFTPIQGGEENNMCIANSEAEFEPLTEETSPPKKARDAALGFLKEFEKFKPTNQD